MRLMQIPVLRIESRLRVPLSFRSEFPVGAAARPMIAKAFPLIRRKSFMKGKSFAITGCPARRRRTRILLGAPTRVGTGAAA
jgi:hypothetical protein